VWTTATEVTLPFIPKFVNGTIIILASLEFLTAGVIDSYGVLSRREYAIMLIMLLVIIFTGGRVELAMAFGIFLGLTDFVVNYARSTDTPRTLNIDVEGCVAIQLKGYLFFATAPGVVDLLLDRLVPGDGEPAKVLIVDWSQVTGVDTKGALECSRLLFPQGPRLILCGASDAVLEGLSHAGICPHMHGGPSRVVEQDIEMVGLEDHARGIRSSATTECGDQVPANEPLPCAASPLPRARLMSLSFRVSRPCAVESPQIVAVRDLNEAVVLAETMVQALLPASNVGVDES